MRFAGYQPKSSTLTQSKSDFTVPQVCFVDSSVRDVKRVFFTDEKNFYLNPPVNNQNDRIWASGKKADVNPERLLVEREKFTPHVMVSAGMFRRQGTAPLC